MPTAYSRVTLVNGARQVDLAVPGAVPLADVLPQLVRYCAPDERVDEPMAWTLGRLGGPDLSLTTTLRDAEVADGEVLELRTPGAVTRPAYVEDVRDAVDDAVDESGRRWTPASTAGFALAMAAALMAAAALLPAATRPRDALAIGTAGTIAGLGVLCAWWADRRGHAYAVHAVLATAMLWGGVGGWLLSTFQRWPWPAGLAAALAGGFAVAALGRAVTAAATGHLAGAAMLAVAGLPLGGLALAGHDWMTGVRVDAVLAVLVVGVLARVSLTVGGLAGEDYRVRRGGMVTADALGARIRQSAALLYGGLGAACVTGAVAALVLTTTGEALWDRLLGLAVGLGLVLRSRVFSRVPQVVPLRVAGLAVLAAQGLEVARRWPVTAAVLASTVLVTASGLPLSDVARARVRRLLNLAELAVVVVMTALLAGALGGYEWVGRVAA
jgi:type VII secretion integral membrane protein EccD